MEDGIRTPEELAAMMIWVHKSKAPIALSQAAALVGLVRLHHPACMVEQAKFPKLIVVMAFDRDEEGELQTVFGPVDQQSEDRAVRVAKGLADKHAGVIAWSRVADIALGEYWEPAILFQAGAVPDME